MTPYPRSASCGALRLPHLDLFLEVLFEVGQQGEEDGQAELEHLRHRGRPVLGERHAQVLLDGRDEHVVGGEHVTGRLQDRQQQLQRQHLGAQLVRSGGAETGRGEGRGDVGLEV